MTHLTTLCPSIYKSTVVSVTARIRRVTRLERLLNWRLVGYNVSFILLTRPLCIYLSIHVFPWSSIVQSLKLPTWLGALEFSPRLDVSYRLHCIQFFSARPIYLSVFFLGRPLTPSTDLIVLDALSRTLVVFHSHKLFTPLCLKISRSTYWTNDILPILFLISGYSA